MFNPAQLTLGEIAAAFRDFVIIGVIIKAAWHSRGFYEHAKSLKDRLVQHMDFMEKGMSTLLDNHLTHIESDLAKLAQKKEE